MEEVTNTYKNIYEMLFRHYYANARINVVGALCCLVLAARGRVARPRRRCLNLDSSVQVAAEHARYIRQINVFI